MILTKMSEPYVTSLPSLTRRYFSIRLLGTIGIAGFCPWGFAKATENNGQWLRDTLPGIANRIIDHPQSLVSLGRWYKKYSPDDSLQDLYSLISRISEDADQSDSLNLIETKLRQQIKLDFEQARVVCVNGWVLSRIEACLCAMISNNNHAALEKTRGRDSNI